MVLVYLRPVVRPREHRVLIVNRDRNVHVAAVSATIRSTELFPPADYRVLATVAPQFVVVDVVRTGDVVASLRQIVELLEVQRSDVDVAEVGRYAVIQERRDALLGDARDLQVDVLVPVDLFLRRHSG